MIGVLDSGIGGITVLRELIKVLPNQHFLYYSDSSNCPYGDKSKEEVYQIVKSRVQFLIRKGCVVIVIACNTASALTVHLLREEYPEILFIAIEPAYKMVHDYNPNGKTIVMATRGTIESEKFLNLYHKYDNHDTILLPCVGLAELIEEGDDSQIEQYLESHLGNYLEIKNVVLGCTHYPLIKKNIAKVLGDVQFFDGSVGVSHELVRQLKLHGILLPEQKLLIDFYDSSNDLKKRQRFFELLHVDN